jgi:hypothetical protein
LTGDFLLTTQGWLEWFLGVRVMVWLPLFRLPTAGNDVITGLASDDLLAGYLGNDTLNGGDGDDVFVEAVLTWQDPSRGAFVQGRTYDFGLGNDRIDGGKGIDAVFYTGSLRGAVIDLARGTVQRGAEIDTLWSVEAYILGDSADRVLANMATATSTSAAETTG